MANSEGEVRHNPTRTKIPHTFVDLGKLFDEDSKEEYMRYPGEGRVRRTHATGEEFGAWNDESEPVARFEEDFRTG